ncbi:DUF718 domain protein [Choiromyces venosus 120613-1]|uniref:DUF718 domain protein n=1 Tax=Choiromyces venosus 120613-1 TaxID=1336337 RepID=A0A3N4JL40_9PEZI|nr:DUF718 domain protein [Choiromyces venosus 120613-1]
MTSKPALRIGQIVRLKPSAVEEYKACHAAVWPEVLDQITDCKIRDYSIFYDAGTGILFATLKYIGNDWDTDMARMSGNPKVREWWEMTDGMQESFVEGAVGSVSGPGWWTVLEEVFYKE